MKFNIEFKKILKNGIVSSYKYFGISASNEAEAISKAERRAFQWHKLANYDEVIIF